MVRKTISVPSEMADFISSRLASGMYGNDSEYFRELVRSDQLRLEREASKQAFQQMIAESIASGHTERTLGEILDEARRRAQSDKDPAPSG